MTKRQKSALRFAILSTITLWLGCSAVLALFYSQHTTLAQWCAVVVSHVVATIIGALSVVGAYFIYEAKYDQLVREPGPNTRRCEACCKWQRPENKICVRCSAPFPEQATETPA